MNTPTFVSAFCLGLFLFINQVLASDPAPSSLIAFSPDRSSSVQIFPRPCVLPTDVLDQIPLSVRIKLQGAEMVIDGRHLAGCWVASPPFVYIIDEEGDTGKISMEMFEPGVES